MAVQTDPKRIEDVVLHEQENRMSREKGVFQTGNTFTIGQVLGKDYKSITGFTQDSGSGVSESHVSLGSEAKQGDYVIHGTGSNTARIVGPDGYEVEQVTSLPYSGDHLEISDSASISDTDKYTVTVGDSTGDFVPLDPTAVNGAQEAHGISLGAYDASSADVDGVALVKQAVLETDGLDWPDGISDANKAKALEELKEKGIVTRAAA